MFNKMKYNRYLVLPLYRYSIVNMGLMENYDGMVSSNQKNVLPVSQFILSNSSSMGCPFLQGNTSNCTSVVLRFSAIVASAVMS